MKLGGFSLESPEESKPIVLQGLSKTSRPKKKSTKKRKPRESKYYTGTEADLARGMFDSQTRINESVRRGDIIIILGTHPEHYIKAMKLSREHLEIFFEVYNELDKHIAYGVRVR